MAQLANPVKTLRSIAPYALVEDTGSGLYQVLGDGGAVLYETFGRQEATKLFEELVDATHAGYPAVGSSSSEKPVRPRLTAADVTAFLTPITLGAGSLSALLGAIAATTHFLPLATLSHLLGVGTLLLVAAAVLHEAAAAWVDLGK